MNASDRDQVDLYSWVCGAIFVIVVISYLFDPKAKVAEMATLDRKAEITSGQQNTTLGNYFESAALTAEITCPTLALR